MARAKFKKYLFYLVLMAFLGNIGAGSMKSQEIEIKGRIFVMGHEPFTQVAIEIADGRVFALKGDYGKELRKLQGRQVTVKGISGDKNPQGVETIEVKEFKVLE